MVIEKEILYMRNMNMIQGMIKISFTDLHSFYLIIRNVIV